MEMHRRAPTAALNQGDALFSPVPGGYCSGDRRRASEEGVPRRARLVSAGHSYGDAPPCPYGSPEAG
jgi:hypothetical protein